MQEVADIPLGYSIPGACHATSLSRSALYLAIGAGKLDARKNNKRVIITGESVRAFIANLPRAEIRAPKSAA